MTTSERAPVAVRERPSSAPRVLRGRLAENRADALVTLAIVVCSALPFLLSPLRARFLGPVGRGEFAFFQAVLTITGAFAASGLRLAFYESGVSSATRFRLGLRGPVLLSAGVGLAIVAGGAAIAFIRLGSPIVAIALLLCALLAPGYSILQVEIAAAQRETRRPVVFGASSAPAIIEFTLNGVLFATRLFTLTTAIIATMLAETGRVLVGLVTRARDRRRSTVAPDPVESKRFSASSRRFAALTIVPVLCTNIDTFIWGAFLPTSALGLYAVSKLGYSFFLMLGASTEGRALRRFTSGGRIGYLAGIIAPAAVLAAAAALAGRLLVPLLFGPAFTPAAVAFPFAAAGGLLAFLFVSLSAVSAGLGHQRVARRAPVILLSAVIAVSLAVALTRTHDVIVMTAALAGAQAIGVGGLCLLLLLERRRPAAPTERSDGETAAESGSR